MKKIIALLILAALCSPLQLRSMQPTAVAAIVATAEIATAKALVADMKKIIAPLGGVLSGDGRQGSTRPMARLLRCMAVLHLAARAS